MGADMDGKHCRRRSFPLLSVGLCLEFRVHVHVEEYAEASRHENTFELLSWSRNGTALQQCPWVSRSHRETVDLLQASTLLLLSWYVHPSAPHPRKSIARAPGAALIPCLRKMAGGEVYAFSTICLGS